MPTLESRNFIAPLIDTHTHFDDFAFDQDRIQLAHSAYEAGVRHLLLVGYLAKYFERLKNVKSQLQRVNSEIALETDVLKVPTAHLAMGLHPAYIAEHTQADLESLARFVTLNPPIAIGEIGLDTFTDELKAPDAVAKQKQFFIAQLNLAVEHHLPVLLHIRKAHAETLAILKSHSYNAKKLGGIAHSFSGGEQEAKAFIKLGFKLGVTGQITNPNSKKLHRSIVAAVEEYGLECLVLETDCPDMTPIQCQVGHTHTRNEPENLGIVLTSLSELLAVEPEHLAIQLWQNSCDALNVNWVLPDVR